MGPAKAYPIPHGVLLFRIDWRFHPTPLNAKILALPEYEATARLRDALRTC